MRGAAAHPAGMFRDRPPQVIEVILFFRETTEKTRLLCVQKSQRVMWRSPTPIATMMVRAGPDPDWV